MSSTREHLLGYLLGALEEAEMAAVERELDRNPQLRKDLAAIEAALFPLGFPERDDEAAGEGPPRGLVARTCEFVDDAKEDLVPRPASLMSPENVSPAAAARRVRWADVVVVASVSLAAIALLFPAILSSRQNAQITACSENLRYAGVALAEFAGRSSDGRYPVVPMSGNRSFAGVYAALLKEEQLLDDAQRLVCPSSDMAESTDSFRVASLSEVDRASGEALVRLQRMMGGSYAYNLGYVENGRHLAPKYEGRSDYVIMSDAPATFSPRKTKNHGSQGQNMLYDDGHVKWIVSALEDLDDDPYLNRTGIVAAGVDCADVVLGESLAKPMPPLMQPIE
jgi:anti-sigma factor RsiW